MSRFNDKDDMGRGRQGPGGEQEADFNRRLVVMRRAFSNWLFSKIERPRLVKRLVAEATSKTAGSEIASGSSQAGLLESFAFDWRGSSTKVKLPSEWAQMLVGGGELRTVYKPKLGSQVLEGRGVSD